MRENQYLGVNAHLQSYYQSHSGWEVFHTNHITQLAEAIDGILPAGYEVGIEESLQVQEYHPDSGERIRRYDYEQRPPADGMGGVTQPIVETFRIDLDAVVLRFELLSATNKPGGSGDLQYEIKRANTLKSGVRLVDVPIPELTLPLAGDDVVQVDFGAVYNLTYSSLGIYSRRVDYSVLPERFETYSPIDQERIRQRMRMVTG